MGCYNSKVDSETEVDLSVTNKDRKCTDIFCCLIFLIFFTLWVGVGGYAMYIGDPYRVLYASDYEGNTCGTEGRGKYAYYPRLSDDLAEAVMNNPGIQLTDLSTDMISLYGICMEGCPLMDSVVCNYDILEVPTIDEMDSGCSNLLLRQSNPLCQSCWIVPLNSANVLYRCLWEEATISAIEEVCEYPSDADVTSTDCISKKVITTTVDIKPAQENSVIDSLSSFGGTISKWMGDLQKSNVVILACGVGLAVVLGFVWLIFLQYCAGTIVWVTLWGSVFLSFGLSLFCFYKGGYFTVENFEALVGTISTATNTTIDVSSAIDMFNSSLSEFESKLPDSVTSSTDTTLYYTIGAWVMLVMSIIMTCICTAFAKKVKSAIGVLKEASKAIQDIPIVILYPIFTMTLSLILLGWFMATSAAIKSLGDFSLESLNVSLAIDSVTANITSNYTGSVTSVINQYKESQLSDPLSFANIFGFLWVYNFIAGFGFVTIAGTIGEWYFTRPPAEGRKDLPNSTLVKAFCRTFRYHLGSIAFGSFIVAVVQMMRICLEYVDRQTKNLQEGNAMIKLMMKVVKCCLWCFEKVIKYLTNNAYILVATRGTPFLKSACTSFTLLLKNAVTIGILNIVAAFMMFLGKIFIVFMSVYAGYIWLEYDERFAAASATSPGGELELSSKAIPLVLIGFFSFMMADAFLGIYGMAIDTVMLCFCEDLSAYGNNAPDKYYMGTDLRRALGFKGKGKQADPIPEENEKEVELTEKVVVGTTPEIEDVDEI